VISRGNRSGGWPMGISTRALGAGLVGLALVGTANRGTPTRVQGVRSEETVRSVRKMLERLPYYGVFDFLVFSVDRGTVTLAGYAYEGNLKRCGNGHEASGRRR